MDLVLCPPAVYLVPVVAAVAETRGDVAVGGQNAHDQESGAFTGEVAPQMLVDVGCRYVILGHSERRTLFGETDAAVNAKAKAALAVGLTPIVCVGETLEEREAGRTEAVVTAQVQGSLAGLGVAGLAKTVIAYEPVWAIGTGVTASPEQAESAHEHLRKWVATRYNASFSEKLRILYGGSVTKSNARELLHQTDIDGLLVGGASLDPGHFVAICEQASEVAALAD